MRTLKKKADFKRVYERGEKKADKNFVVFAFSNVNDGESLNKSPRLYRVGVSVSRKVGNSVVRNKVRRRVKEVCRLYGKENKRSYPFGFDFIALARKPAAFAEFSEIKRSLITLFSKLSKNYGAYKLNSDLRGGCGVDSYAGD